ncbi:HFI1 (YPL254W) [Zygosaccharomyces parabailii]|uniref:ZYBA0S08-04478g1_1 n=1 Tax=Zygosaccharomyces bailii (strain CLIB 213 / ATCC 58445 / CBS 680 / BCRC 21525 / NBRC 1098 / NCYC 1416 / NRRL Y-2227) TaxID=1333698 RepID=A0A8J2T9L4_ZYGB2|nr:HFI1 (YPL254W) [Zygosaccharomyces parabailii]CDF90844.1 ZYBA0S08-04478g1_1 [Zygosaccharomyces bailii CLIB 213]CDH09027.1 related to Transcriptional coactivator HFI1/ADA1 [Zygosaccharomyces bailii ISA1307]
MSLVKPQSNGITSDGVHSQVSMGSVASPARAQATTMTPSVSDNGKEGQDNQQQHQQQTMAPSNQRIDLLGEFTGLLGKENWTKYAQVISLFILGKLSRKELCNELDLLFQPLSSGGSSMKPALVRLHNQLLLGIMTNSLKNSPMTGNDSSWGFGNGSANGSKSKRVNKHNSQIETYKKIVMSLPVNDRRRLKGITKEAGKRGFVLCSVLQARLATIPKIPIVINPETLKRIKSNNLKTPLEWSQDIMTGFNAPLATDNYSLPDTESLFLRMVGIAREHGLVGTVDTGCVELLSLALDNYLKDIIESAIDTVRYRRKRYSEYYDIGENGMYEPVSKDPTANEEDVGETPMTVSLTNEDLYECFTLFPNLVEPMGSIVSLPIVGLVNDDELVVTKSSIDDLPDFAQDKPTFTPLDERNVGTREELNWLIKDILTEE